MSPVKAIIKIATISLAIVLISPRQGVAIEHENRNDNLWARIVAAYNAEPGRCFKDGKLDVTEKVGSEILLGESLLAADTYLKSQDFYRLDFRNFEQSLQERFSHSALYKHPGDVMREFIASSQATIGLELSRTTPETVISVEIVVFCRSG